MVLADGAADLALTLSGVELVDGAVLADGLEALVDGAEDSVDGAEDSVDGAMIHSGTHSGAADLEVGVEASVAGAADLVAGAADLADGADGTLTLLDTGTHTDQFTMVAV